MSIIYIHGVKVRSAEHGESLRAPMIAWLGPKVGPKADYLPVFWGGLCATQFGWNLASRPPTPLTSQGASDVADSIGLLRSSPIGLASVPRPPAAVIDDAVLGAPEVVANPEVLAGLPVPDRPDVVAALYLSYRANTDGGGSQDEM